MKIRKLDGVGICDDDPATYYEIDIDPEDYTPPSETFRAFFKEYCRKQGWDFEASLKAFESEVRKRFYRRRWTPHWWPKWRKQ